MRDSRHRPLLITSETDGPADQEGAERFQAAPMFIVQIAGDLFDRRESCQVQQLQRSDPTLVSVRDIDAKETDTT